MTMKTNNRSNGTPVRVTLTVRVDLDAWRDEYADHGATAEQIREAVRSSILSAVTTDGVVAPVGIVLSADVAEWAGR